MPRRITATSYVATRFFLLVSLTLLCWPRCTFAGDLTAAPPQYTLVNANTKEPISGTLIIDTSRSDHPEGSLSLTILADGLDISADIADKLVWTLERSPGDMNPLAIQFFNSMINNNISTTEKLAKVQIIGAEKINGQPLATVLASEYRAAVLSVGLAGQPPIVSGLPVQIVPRAKTIDLRLDQRSLPTGSTLYLETGQIKSFSTTVQSGDNKQIRGLVFWEVASPTTAAISGVNVDGNATGFQAGKFVGSSKAAVSIKALQEGETKITVTSGDAMPIIVNIVVRDKIAAFTINPAAATLLEQQEQTLEIVAKAADSTFRSRSATWQISPDSPSKDAIKLLQDSGISIKIKAQKPGTAKIRATYKEGDTTLTADTVVTVNPLSAQVDYLGPTALLVKNPYEARLRFRDSTNNEIGSGVAQPFTVSSSNSNVLLVTQDATDPYKLLLKGLKQGEALLLVDVGDKTLIRQPITIEAIGDFRKVRAKLKLMDDRTVTDAFGGRTAAEYYAIEATISNNLDNLVGDDKQRFQGRSIFVYSNSIEVRVTLERKFDSKLGPSDVDKSTQWTVITGKDYRKQFENFMPPTTETTLTPQYSVPSDEVASNASLIVSPSALTLTAGDSSKVYVQLVPAPKKNVDSYYFWRSSNPSVATVSRRGIVYARAAGQTDIEVVLAGTSLKGVVHITVTDDLRPYQFVYRPYSAQLMLDTVDVRNNEVTRFGVFNIASGLATLGSFFTASDVILRGGTAERVLDKFTNLLIPGLQRLFPNLRDQQRRNLERHLMNPTEEIAFGGNIQKVLLFPKKAFGSIFRGHQTRIAAIDITSLNNIEVGVVTDRDSGPTAPENP